MENPPKLFQIIVFVRRPSRMSVSLYVRVSFLSFPTKMEKMETKISLKKAKSKKKKTIQIRFHLRSAPTRSGEECGRRRIIFFSIP